MAFLRAFVMEISVGPQSYYAILRYTRMAPLITQKTNPAGEKAVLTSALDVLIGD
jgi:hypothetical protein